MPDAFQNVLFGYFDREGGCESVSADRCTGDSLPGEVQGGDSTHLAQVVARANSHTLTGNATGAIHVQLYPQWDQELPGADTSAMSYLK